MKTIHYSHSPIRYPIEKLLPWLRLVLLAIVLVIILRAGLAKADAATGNQGQTASVSGSGSSNSLDSSAQVKVTRDARGRKVQHIDFSETTIEGKARTPDGFVIQSRAPGRFKSLIELRSHFRDNIKVHALEASNAVGLGD
ncbi:MAG: hypothetical protein ACO3A4_09275 [Silvanigrellaceae bacterium]